MLLKRNFFIFLFLLCSFLLWKEWNIKIENIKLKEIQFFFNTTVSNISHIHDKKKLIYIKTDVINLVVNANNGNIQEIELLKYQEKLNSFKKLKLLNNNQDFVYQIHSEFFNNNYKNNIYKNKKIKYIPQRLYFKLVNDQKILYVPIKLISKSGIQYIKNFVFKKGSYDIHIEYKINNPMFFNLHFNILNQLKQKFNIDVKNNIVNKSFKNYDIKNIAYSIDNKKYDKFSINNIIHNKKINIFTNNGWIAILKKYFVIAWIINIPGNNIVYTNLTNNHKAVIQYQSSKIIILPKEKKIIRTILWTGPKIQNKMSLINPSLALTIDYGWCWFLSQPLFKLLNILYYFLKNWGFSIILITLIMKTITYPLSKSQYISIIKMKKLEPKIYYLKNRFQNDKNMLNQEILKLYKQENINPLGGFLPVLLQMPIFFSLYSMLVNSIELRYAPFIFWIHDLSNRDPYYILPILMGITMYYVQKTSPTDLSYNNNLQSNIMNLVPIIFSLFFLWFPSGLVLYYVISNIATIIQQIIIYKNFKKNKNI